MLSFPPHSSTRLGKAVQDMVGRLSSTIHYYSSWGHLKELVLVPHRRRDRSSVHLKSTVIRRDGATTTILLTKDDKRKDKKDDNLSEQPLKSMDARRQNTKHSMQGGQHKAKATVPDTKQSSQEANTPKSKAVDEGTSPAKEVEDYLYREVYFTQSKAPRGSKSSAVRFSVGQVVSHVTEGYYGVIIGWDAVAQAPESWIDTYYSQRKVGAPASCMCRMLSSQ